MNLFVFHSAPMILAHAEDPPKPRTARWNPNSSRRLRNISGNTEEVGPFHLPRFPRKPTATKTTLTTVIVRPTVASTVKSATALWGATPEGPQWSQPGLPEGPSSLRPQHCPLPLLQTLGLHHALTVIQVLPPINLFCCFLFLKKKFHCTEAMLNASRHLSPLGLVEWQLF